MCVRSLALRSLLFEGYCPHTGRLIGYAHDAFDMDVIREMFLNNCPEKSKEDEQEVPDEDLSEEKNKGATSNGKEGVSLGNHYMVFMV